MLHEIPQDWQEWIDENLDLKVAPKQLKAILIKENRFHEDAITTCFLKAKIRYSMYQKLISNIKADFNKPDILNANIQTIRDFLQIITQDTLSHIILKRFATHWLSLDASCANPEIRARKIAFLNALDIIIHNREFPLTFPNPVTFGFFPTHDNVCQSNDADLQHFRDQKLDNLSLQPITQIRDDVLYLLKDHHNQPITLGSGTHGVIYKGFYQNKLVAIKHSNLQEHEFLIQWVFIKNQYRQSLITHEKSFDNILAMQEIFFYKENSVFDNNALHSIVAIFPLCQHSLDDLIEQDHRFNHYDDLKPFKTILHTLVTLHHNQICINDFRASNILIDHHNQLYFNDLDFWMPTDFTNLASTYLNEISIADPCCAIHEIECLRDGDLSKIVPEKIDIWCFAATMLMLSGDHETIGDLMQQKVEILKTIRTNGRSDPHLQDRITALADLSRHFTTTTFQKLSDQITNEKNNSKKELLTDIKEVLTQCFADHPDDRPNAKDLLNHRLFTKS